MQSDQYQNQIANLKRSFLFLTFRTDCCALTMLLTIFNLNAIHASFGPLGLMAVLSIIVSQLSWWVSNLDRFLAVRSAIAVALDTDSDAS
jgi:hypothetical protein